MVAFKRNGLEDTPNTTRVNLNVVTLGRSFLILSTQRKRRASLSCDATDTIKKAFSISAASAIRWVRNLNRMSIIF